jgi:hypothetical protein
MHRQQLFVFLIDHDDTHITMARHLQELMIKDPHISKVSVFVNGDRGNSVLETHISSPN